MVITHARALHRSVPEGGCGSLQADIRRVRPAVSACRKADGDHEGRVRT